MRTINYRVGSEIFKTFNEAQGAGKIDELIFVDVDTNSDRYNENCRKQARKIMEKLRKGEF